MSRLLLVSAVTVAASLLAPNVASADDKAGCPRKLERSYSKHYDKVARVHGTRAPGRNIRKWGVVKRNQTVRFARCSEIRRSLRQLKSLLAPPPAPYTNVSTAVTAATDPAQMPSGVQTATTVSSGGSSNPMVDPNCESSGNPQIVDPSGAYWGKYQFDQQTWVAHGGSPSSYGNASEVEQDAIAQNVDYDAWPNC